MNSITWTADTASVAGPVDFAWMVGRPVQIALAGPETWSLALGEDGAVAVMCPWRLLHQGRIAVTSADDQQQFGQPSPIDAAGSANTLLTGQVIRQVWLGEGTADLTLQLGDYLLLQIIALSSGYENWHATSPMGQEVVAIGGGELWAR